MPNHKYTAAQIRFLERNVAGRAYVELAGMFNKRFGLSLSASRIGGALKRHNLSNGRDSRFRPGQPSHNKGKKGVYYAGCEKGWFRKGGVPPNHRPVGSERVTADGYLEVKVAEPRTWRHKHVIVWEKANGKVPEGSVVIFADGNRRNLDLENLLPVSRAELAVMNHTGLVSRNGDLTRAGKEIAAIRILIASRNKRAVKKRGKKKIVFLDNNGRRVFVAKDGGYWAAARDNPGFGIRRLRSGRTPARRSFLKAQNDLNEYAIQRQWQME